MPELPRRRFLLASAGVGLAGLAGCSSVGESPDATTTEETSTPEGTDTPTATTEPTTDETSETATTHGDGHHIHGRLMLEIDGERIDLSQSKYFEENTGNSKFHFHDDGHQYKWHNHGEPVTVEYALNALPDVEFEDDDGSAVLTVDGTTYEASEQDTTLVFRQRTTDVDPRTYELQDGDIIWVKAYTEGRTETPHA